MKRQMRIPRGLLTNKAKLPEVVWPVFQNKVVTPPRCSQCRQMMLSGSWNNIPDMVYEAIQSGKRLLKLEGFSWCADCGTTEKLVLQC